MLEILSSFVSQGGYAATLSPAGTWKFLVYCLDPSLAFSRIGNCRKFVFFQARLENLADLFDLEISFTHSTWADWNPRVEFFPVSGSSLISQISRESTVCWLVADISVKEEISRSFSGNFQVMTFDELLTERNFQARTFLFDSLPKFARSSCFSSKEISRFSTLHKLARGKFLSVEDQERNFQVTLLLCAPASRIIFSRDCPIQDFFPPWLQPSIPSLEICTVNMDMEISHLPPKPKRKRGPPKPKPLEIICTDILEDAPMSPRFPRFPEEEISRSCDLISSIPRPFTSRLRLCRAK
jgi:hypothetical protein